MPQKTLFDLTENNKKKTTEKELSEELLEETSEEFEEEPSEELEQETSIQLGEEIKDDKYGWKQLKDIKGKDVGQYYTNIELISSSDLSGTKYYINETVSSEHPQGMLGSMWGGGYSFNLNKLDEVKKHFDEMMESKKHRLTEKYRKFTDEETKISYQHHNAYYFFRLIPANNFFVIISDKLIEMLKETGFDFEKWYKEYRSLPENEATKEDWELALDTLQLYKKGDKIVDRLEKDDENDLSMFAEEKISDDDLIKQLKEVAEKIKNNENKLGHLTYSKPFWFELKRYGEKK